jgi:hypothetical protein
MSTNGTTNGITKEGFTLIELAQVEKLGMAAYRAPSLLQPHRAREALADAHAGKIPPLIGYFSCLASPPIAKLVAQLGFDVILIDWEHSGMNAETMTQVGYNNMCGYFMLILLDGSRCSVHQRRKNHCICSVGTPNLALRQNSNVLIEFLAINTKALGLPSTRERVSSFLK